jgi:hypothetical protein
MAPAVLGFFLNFSRKPLSESRLRNFARENVQRTMRQLFSGAKSCRAYRLLKILLWLQQKFIAPCDTVRSEEDLHQR